MAEEEEEEKDDEEQEIQALQQRAKMRAEERKTGKITAEVLTVGPGTGGNQPKYPGEEGLGQKGSVRLPGRLGEKAPAQGSASSDRQTLVEETGKRSPVVALGQIK